MRTVPIRLLAATLLSLSSATALATPVTWDHAFEFRGSGPSNPLVLFGFNPQPEPPPGPALVSLSGGGAGGGAGGPTDPVLTHEGLPGDVFRVLFAIQGEPEEEPIQASPAALTMRPVGNSFSIDILDGAGALAYVAELTLGSSSGGVPIDWVGFNPQPEPPALVGAATFGADFTFSSFSPVSAQLTLTTGSGAPIALAQVPAPGPLGLLLLGGCCALLARRYQPMP